MIEGPTGPKKPTIEEELVDRMEKRLNTSPSPSNFAYEAILQDAADIREKKVHLYGEEAYNGSDSTEDIWDRFCDVKRKFCRMKTLTKRVAEGDKEAIRPLADAYRDILNYGAMGVQIIEKHFGKQPLDLS